jgi:hypothetical protein
MIAVKKRRKDFSVVPFDQREDLWIVPADQLHQADRPDSCF